jgi:hypothetical protein
MFFFNIAFIAVIFLLNISKNKTIITYFFIIYLQHVSLFPCLHIYSTDVK